MYGNGEIQKEGEEKINTIMFCFLVSTTVFADGKVQW